MQGCAPDHLTGRAAPATSSGLASFFSWNISAANDDQLSPEDLLSGGQTACQVGAVQLSNPAVAASDRSPWAVLTEAAVDEIDPELLLPTAYAACFWRALMLVYSDTQMPRGSFVTIIVTQSGFSTQAFGLGVAPCVSLPGLDQTGAKALIRQAHELCPYTHQSRSNIDVRLAA